MYPYRVFVSYSRDDQELAGRVQDRLRDIGARPVSDATIAPGAPFTEEIEQKISFAHVFMPLLTQAGSQRPRVHQEIGFALGQGVPVVPLSMGVRPEGMTWRIHALTVSPDLCGLDKRVVGRVFDRVVHRAETETRAAFAFADQIRERSEQLVRLMEYVEEEGGFQRIRQRTAFGSFSIPDRHVDDDSWKRRHRHTPRTEEVCKLLRRERELMEEHSRNSGCDFILDPLVTMADEDAWRVRIETMLEAFESLRNLAKDTVRVVFQRGNISGNLIIVGDWFVSEAVVPKTEDQYRHTSFTAHGPTVLRRLREFERLFDDLLGDMRLRPGETSLDRAIAELRSLLDDKAN